MEETHLTRLLALVGGRAAVTALPERSERRVIVEVSIGESRRNLLRADAFRLQLRRDPAPAVTPRLLRNERVRVTRIGEIALSGELVERRANLALLPSFGDELVFQLGARIFAPRELSDRLRV